MFSESCCHDEAATSTRPSAEFGLFKALHKYKLMPLRHYQQRCFAQMHPDVFCEAPAGAFAPLSVHSLPSPGSSTKGGTCKSTSAEWLQTMPSSLAKRCQLLQVILRTRFIKMNTKKTNQTNKTHHTANREVHAPSLTILVPLCGGNGAGEQLKGGI